MKLNRLSIIYALSDFLASAVAWTLFFLLRHNLDLTCFSDKLHSSDYIKGLTIIPLCWVFLFMLTGFYVVSLKRSRLVELVYSLSVTVPGVIIQFFIFLFLGFITENSLYLYFLEALFVFQFLLTYIPRAIITSTTAIKVHKGLIGFNTLIVGSNGKAYEVFDRIKIEKIRGGNLLMGYVSITEGGNGLLKNLSPCLGQTEELPGIISDNKVEEVIIAIEGNEFDTLEKIIGLLEFRDVTIKAIPSLKDILTGRVKHTAIFGTPLLEISNLRMPVWQANIKQMTDYFLAGASLVVLSPVMLLLAVLIRFSGKGAIIFSQERIGKNGKSLHHLQIQIDAGQCRK